MQHSSKNMRKKKKKQKRSYTRGISHPKVFALAGIIKIVFSFHYLSPFRSLSLSLSLCICLSLCLSLLRLTSVHAVHKLRQHKRQ